MVKTRSAAQTDPAGKVMPAGTAAKERIVAGARRHFFTHGLRGVSMDDLAKSLGMSKKTLYVHFPGKTALVEAALQVKFREIEGQLEEISSKSSSDFTAALHRMLACFQQHMDEIHPPFLRDIQREAPGMFELADARRRSIVLRYFGRLLSEGQRTGIIREDIEINMMLEILLGAVQAIMNPPKMAELGLTLKSGFVAIIDVFLKGVVTEQGRSKI
jgi:AcrR family transcriptional regulator